MDKVLRVSRIGLFVRPRPVLLGIRSRGKDNGEIPEDI